MKNKILKSFVIIIGFITFSFVLLMIGIIIGKKDNVNNYIDINSNSKIHVNTKMKCDNVYKEQNFINVGSNSYKCEMLTSPFIKMYVDFNCKVNKKTSICQISIY